MSRYHVTVGTATFAYGYDHPLREYFLQRQRNRPGKYPVIRDLVGSLTGGGYGTASELLAAVAQHGVPIPDEHREAAENDRPF